MNFDMHLIGKCTEVQVHLKKHNRKKSETESVAVNIKRKKELAS